MDYDKHEITGYNNFKFIRYDNEFWFSQKTISEILGVKSHTINWHIKEIERVNTNFKDLEFRIAQIEGSREISRNIKHYPFETLFDISMRCNNLRNFNDMIKHLSKKYDVNLDFQVRPIKEKNFKEMLEKALHGIVSFEYQYRIDGYIIDFYFPEIDLCVEYDEHYHKYQLNKDELREEKIKKYLECDFLRIKSIYWCKKNEPIIRSSVMMVLPQHQIERRRTHGSIQYYTGKRTFTRTFFKRWSG